MAIKMQIEWTTPVPAPTSHSLFLMVSVAGYVSDTSTEQITQHTNSSRHSEDKEERDRGTCVVYRLSVSNCCTKSDPNF